MMTVMGARREDPREYGYMLAVADLRRDTFQQRVHDEPDLLRAELMAEGWNEAKEEMGRDDLLVTAR